MAGSPCPVEVMKQVQSLMHMRDVAIAYGMTETSPVCTQTRIGAPLDKQVGTVGQVHPHVEIKIVDPADRSGGAGRRARRAVHARLQRDARLLGQRRGHARGHRRGALDAHRRPRHDGRRGLPEHRRAHQGHDHPRRRERVPARDRGVPLQPPQDAGRPGHRRARREVRRGDHGLGQARARARRPPSRRSATTAAARSPTTRSRAT